jgi:hypothetical protein
MKIVIGALAIVVLMTIAQSTFAQAPLSKHPQADYQSGFEHGVSDGKDSCLHPDGCHWYILGKDKGFAFHTKEFIRGYITGWCTSSPPGGGSDADQARFECGKPGYFPEGN